ncbi:DNA-binding transcriptional activator of the SARP family [Geodermatophilus pulveris]|uniref:DNA-binding transcriptional activator of the SARP family n=1 Tax=Geodermatophilus pulveris TaxID=1564159 RepID=A0A239C4Z2_9ACTN|nr:BTAD domain-containing putative transcriptional regulator [Geodermatophilus pulveris]SNS14748.1 DNA-binding transcriptional activator of the SARP family [Geodermatophilus pulveris]
MDRPPLPRVSLLDGFGLALPGRGRRPAAGDLPHAVQRLVAHLCLSPRSTRTGTAGRLWPDVPEDRAHGSLRSALWRLNKAAPGLVEASGSAIGLATDVRVDVRDLDDWARRVIAAHAGPEDLAVPDAALLGDLLPGWYDDWVLLEREQLRQLRTQALEVVADRLASSGRPWEALEAAHAAIRAEPLRESAHRTVVRVHLAEGNVAEAVRAYELFRTMLRDELGVLPTEQMTRLVEHVPRVRRACSADHATGPEGRERVRDVLVRGGMATSELVRST